MTSPTMKLKIAYLTAAVVSVAPCAAVAQLRAAPDPAPCLARSERIFYQTLALNCQHLEMSEKIYRLQMSTSGLTDLTCDELRVFDSKLSAWRNASQAQRDQLCKAGVEEAKRDAGNPDAWLIYKP